jgi:4-hydroxybenzoate polyprenyltransferase
LTSPAPLGKCRALLASARVANAPGAISNVTLGYLLGYAYWDRGSTPDWSELSLLAAIATALLIAGNLANDWFDRGWDARHRPERALPSGLLPPTLYAGLAAALGAGSLAAALTLGPLPFLATALILGCVGLYTWSHKRTRLAVIPMGLCRAGLYALGFLCFWPSGLTESPEMTPLQPPPGPFVTWARFDIARALLFLATHAFGLFIYIVGLSLAARHESLAEPPTGGLVLSRAMLLLPLAALSCWWIPYAPLAGGLALIPYAIWLGLALTLLRRPIPRLVSALLAGIPLVDLIAAVPLAIGLHLPDLAAPPLAVVAVVVPPAAFLAGLALQKLAPAT